MYAVIETGGQQFRVKTGDTIKIEKLAGAVGDAVALDKVLLVSDGEDLKVGRPYLEGAEVKGAIRQQGRHKKIIVFKKKRRKGYSVKRGHKQHFTEIMIEAIQA